jgi:23S rRNA (pseudouridine1915-N3)-methyltransferase
MKCKILTQGKVKEAWLSEALNEYTKRLEPYLGIEWALFKTPEELEKALSFEKQPFLLDPKGKLIDSEEFHRLVYSQSAVTFGIGGPDGFSEELKKGRKLLSFSPLTFTHQIARLLLLEQLYRACQIERNSPYHR